MNFRVWEVSELRVTVSPDRVAVMAVVESVKAASDVYAPVSGTVVEVNAALADKPETINEDAYGEGWIFVIEAEEPDQLNELLSPDDYADLAGQFDHGAGDWRFHFHRRLVGHDVGDDLVLGDNIADLDVPADQFGLGGAFAHVGQFEDETTHLSVLRS